MATRRTTDNPFDPNFEGPLPGPGPDPDLISLDPREMDGTFNSQPEMPTVPPPILTPPPQYANPITGGNESFETPLPIPGQDLDWDMPRPTRPAPDPNAIGIEPWLMNPPNPANIRTSEPNERLNPFATSQDNERLNLNAASAPRPPAFGQQGGFGAGGGQPRRRSLLPTRTGRRNTGTPNGNAVSSTMQSLLKAMGIS